MLCFPPISEFGQLTLTRVIRTKLMISERKQCKKNWMDLKQELDFINNLASIEGIHRSSRNRLSMDAKPNTT